MARKTTTKRTAAERAEQAKELQASIAAQVEELRNSEQWRRYLDFLQAFHTYSLGNVLLILSQCPHATHVAGYRKWQELGRQVRKGEKALKIFGYSTKKITRKEEDQDQSTTQTKEDENGQRVTVRVRYPVLSVFDISQTDPIEGVEQVSEPVQLLTGEDTAQVVATVTEWLTGQGWTVTRETIQGKASSLQHTAAGWQTRPNAFTGAEEQYRITPDGQEQIVRPTPSGNWHAVLVGTDGAESILYSGPSKEQAKGSFDAFRVNGYTTPDGTRRVVIGDHLSPAAAAKTILHEAAHVLLHTDQDHAEYVAHRGVCEIEAESVAYVVAGLLGIDTSAYSIGYIAEWSNGKAEVIKNTAANVLRAAHTLADLFTTAEHAAA